MCRVPKCNSFFQTFKKNVLSFGDILVALLIILKGQPLSTKGQLISKCSSGVFKSPQKTTKFLYGFLPQPLHSLTENTYLKFLHDVVSMNCIHTLPKYLVRQPQTVQCSLSQAIVQYTELQARPWKARLISETPWSFFPKR